MRKPELVKCKECDNQTYTTLCDICHRKMCNEWNKAEVKRLNLPEVMRDDKRT